MQKPSPYTLEIIARIIEQIRIASLPITPSESHEWRLFIAKEVQGQFDNELYEQVQRVKHPPAKP